MSVRAETRAQPAPIAIPKIESKLIKEQTRLAWILLSPSLLVVALVALIPLIQTIAQSTTNARLASERPVSFVGLANYANLLQDTDFLRSIWVTVQFTIMTVAVEFVLGLGIAMVVNGNFRGRGFMRAAMLVPWAIITVVSAQMWKLMYN
ncbi:MAG TPA: sugar ABC transporter permease, partial [Chloroflexota bacterium]|nr:sugar ABC transporter permease [Chloroflexota bacterium]